MDVTKALNKLKNAGYKYTGKREEMLRLFASERRYLSAKEVLIQMQDVYPSLSFDTVYRNLSLFEQLDILEMTEWDGEKRFRFSCATPFHHHHMICVDCGKTEHIEDCPMDFLEGKVGKGFTITSHKFEIYGYCLDCNPEHA